MNVSCEADPRSGSTTGTGRDQRADAELDRICGELHVDKATATEFAANYLTLLTSRLERIDAELDLLVAAERSAAARTVPGQPSVSATQLNTDPAVVALLSLDASSVMLGAFEVSLAVQRLRRDVQAGLLQTVDEPRRELRDASERLRTRLLALVAAG